MRRLLVALAACSSPSPPHDTPPAVRVPIATPADAAVAVVPDAAPRPALHPRPLPIGPHGHPILALTATEDGAAVLTVDFGGALRLWPALDGTREPIAIPVLAPASEAVVHAGDAFAIATLDAAGGLAILRVTAAGELAVRTVVASEQPLRSVIAIRDGFLAIRDDQAIVRIATDGQIRGTLFPDQGERVEALAYRHDDTLAILTTPSGMRGQWIATAAELAWGGATPGFEIDPATALLSPEHRYLAGIAHRRPCVIDLATGKATAIASGARPVGFADEGHLGFVDDERLGWWDANGKVIGTIVASTIAFTAVATDRGLAGGANRDLLLVDLAPHATARYLGYQTDTPLGLVPTALGLLLDTANGPLALDDELAATSEVAWREATPVDAAQAIAITDQAHCPDPTSCAGRWLASVDPRGRVLDSAFDVDGEVHYEPSTHLVSALRHGDTAVATFDPATHRIGKPAMIGARTLVLLDPALAGGAVALTARDATTADHQRGTAIRIYRALAPAPIAEAPIVLPGVFAAADRAGHVYLQDATGSVAIYAGDQLLGRVDGPLRGWHLRPSPDGRLLATFGENRIALADRGTVRWTAALPKLRDVQWTADGKLVALAGGLVRLDLADGQIDRARCGWRFGLRAAPHDAGLDENTCDP